MYEALRRTWPCHGTAGVSGGHGVHWEDEVISAPFLPPARVTGMSDKENWEVLLMPAGCPWRKWRSCYNWKEGSAEGAERKQKVKQWHMHRCIQRKADGSSLGWYFLPAKQALLRQAILRTLKKAAPLSGQFQQVSLVTGMYVHICTWSFSASCKADIWVITGK